MTDKKGTTLGPTVAPPTGVPQTTIDSKTTTILPNTSILNPVEPDGKPAPEHVKRASTATTQQELKAEEKKADDKKADDKKDNEKK